MLDHKIFYDCVRPVLFAKRGYPGGFLTASQVSGMETLLDRQPEGFRTDYLAYCFATAYHETAHTMQPIPESGKGAKHAYGRPNGPYGQTYYGRGYVQLTHYENYVKATERLRELGFIDGTIDLAREPDLAMRPEIAAAIMYIGMVEGWFTTRKLSNYFGPAKSDPVGARKIINGTDRDTLIAGYYRTIYAAFLKATVVDAAPTLVVRTTLPVIDPAAPPPAPLPSAPLLPQPDIPVPVPFPVPPPAAPPVKASWLSRFFAGLKRS